MVDPEISDSGNKMPEIIKVSSDSEVEEFVEFEPVMEVEPVLDIVGSREVDFEDPRPISLERNKDLRAITVIPVMPLETLRL
jgi:hypothetical protein